MSELCNTTGQTDQPTESGICRDTYTSFRRSLKSGLMALFSWCCGIAVVMLVLRFVLLPPLLKGLMAPPAISAHYETTPSKKESSQTYESRDLDQFIGRLDAYLGTGDDALAK